VCVYIRNNSKYIHVQYIEQITHFNRISEYTNLVHLRAVWVSFLWGGRGHMASTERLSPSKFESRGCASFHYISVFRIPTCNVSDTHFIVIKMFSVYFGSSCKSRNSSVGIDTGYGLDDQMIGVRFSTGVGNFSLRRHVRTGTGAYPASYPVGTGVISLWGKAAGTWSCLLTSI
jgi:hypothetical protein